MSGFEPMMIASALGSLAQTGLGMMSAQQEQRAQNRLAEERHRQEVAAMAERRKREEIGRTRAANEHIARMAAGAAAGGISLDGSTAALRGQFERRFVQEGQDLDRDYEQANAESRYRLATAQQRNLLERRRTDWRAFQSFASQGAGLGARTPLPFRGPQ